MRCERRGGPVRYDPGRDLGDERRALESAHAFAQAFKEAGSLAPDDVVLINQSGRGDKDIFTIADALDDPAWRDFICRKAAEYAAR